MKMIFRGGMFKFTLILFLFLLIISCTATKAPPAFDEEALARETENCAGNNDPSLRDNCFSHLATLQEDAKLCEKTSESFREFCLSAFQNCDALPSSEERDICHKDKVRTFHDKAVTQNLGSSYLTQFCTKVVDEFTRQSCYIEIASLWNEPALCDKVGEMRDRCLYELSVMSQGDKESDSVESCEKIAPDEAVPYDLRKECWFNIQNDKVRAFISLNAKVPLDCRKNANTGDSYDDEKTVSCLTNLAVLNKNAQICDKIVHFTSPAQFQKEDCYEAVAQGIDPNAGALFEEIETPSVKQSDCEALPVSLRKDACLSMLAYTTEDMILCGSLSEPFSQKWCEDQVGAAIGNSDHCEKREGDQKDFCYDNFAENSLNITGCEKISASWKSECFTNVALMTHEPEICEKNTEQQDKEYCYYRFGSRTPSGERGPFCEKIKETNLKQDCYSAVG